MDRRSVRLVDRGWQGVAGDNHEMVAALHNSDIKQPPPPPPKTITHSTLILKVSLEMSLYLIKQHAIKKYVGVR